MKEMMDAAELDRMLGEGRGTGGKGPQRSRGRGGPRDR